jgi:hypothetical protein
MDLIEISLVFFCGSHDLNLGIITIQVDENKLGACSTDGHNSTRNSNFLILKENALLNASGLESLVELINSVRAVKLVRVGVLSFLSYLVDKLLSVVCVLSGIEDLLWGLHLARTSKQLFLNLFFLLLLLGLLLFSQLLSGLELTKNFVSTSNSILRETSYASSTALSFYLLLGHHLTGDIVEV